MAITAATTAASMSAAQSNAKKQLEYNKQVQEQTSKAANDAQVDQTKQLNLALIQEQAGVSDDAKSVQKDKLKAVGRTKVASGEAGVSGISLDNLVGDFNRQESTYIDSLKYNLDMSEDNMMANSKGINANAANRINGARGGIVKRPDMYSAALGIGSQSLDSGSRYLGWGQ